MTDADAEFRARTTAFADEVIRIARDDPTFWADLELVLNNGADLHQIIALFGQQHVATRARIGRAVLDHLDVAR